MSEMKSQVRRDWVDDLLSRTGMSVQDLASTLGVSRQAIYLWKDGKAQISSPKMALLISKLGLEPDFFFERSDSG